MLGLGALDWLLILIAIPAAVLGYRQGLLVGVLSLVGFIGGAVVGILFVPSLLAGMEPGVGVAALAVVLVLAAAFIGQGLLGWIGSELRSKVSSRPGRHVDAIGGSVLSVVGLLVVAWALGLASASAGLPGVSALVRESVVLRAVDRAMPAAPQQISNAFASLAEAGGFPQVVAPFTIEPIISVPPPAVEVADDPDVQRAANSVVKIVGRAEACDRVLEGSGFVMSQNRVMTNAHVVAGVTEPTVLVPGGERLRGQVVYFDPRTDVAVVAVSGLDRPALEFANNVARGDDAVVLGYPNNGPLTGTSARVRGQHVLLGEDIYGAERVEREVISIRSQVRPGNSGGPLMALDGRVYGVIFAASLSDPDTGYALSAGAVAQALETGRTADEAVSTGGCA